MPDTDYRHIIHDPTMEPTIVPLLAHFMLKILI